MILALFSGLTYDITPGFTGLSQISLSDIAMNPDQALAQMGSNFRSNWQQMAISAFATAFVFRMARRLLRVPINNVNRNIAFPLFGKDLSL